MLIAACKDLFSATAVARSMVGMTEASDILFSMCGFFSGGLLTGESDSVSLLCFLVVPLLCTMSPEKLFSPDMSGEARTCLLTRNQPGYLPNTNHVLQINMKNAHIESKFYIVDPDVPNSQ